MKKISANPDDDEGEPEYKFEWQVNSSFHMKCESEFFINHESESKVFNNHESESECHVFLSQRTWGHAPKESYLADGDQFAEQPFGIQVKSQPICYGLFCPCFK